MRSAYIVAVWKQDSHMFQHIGFTVLVGTIYLLLNLLNILPILLMFQILAFLNLQFLLGVTFLWQNQKSPVFQVFKFSNNNKDNQDNQKNQSVYIIWSGIWCLLTVVLFNSFFSLLLYHCILLFSVTLFWTIYRNSFIILLLYHSCDVIAWWKPMFSTLQLLRKNAKTDMNE